MLKGKKERNIGRKLASVIPLRDDRPVDFNQAIIRNWKDRGLHCKIEGHRAGMQIDALRISADF